MHEGCIITLNIILTGESISTIKAWNTKETLMPKVNGWRTGRREARKRRM